MRASHHTPAAPGDGNRLVPVVADVGEPDGAARAVEEAVATLGRLDGLVLNAGIITPGRVGDLSAEEWEAMLRVNLTGAFLIARTALPHLLQANGSVVSVASVAALRASEGMSAYSASKAGMVMLTQSLAVDYGPQGLRANVVCPGWTATEMADAEMAEFGASRGITADEGYRLVTSLVPQRRAAGADEIAAAIEWLLSDRASYLNGAVIPVDGGACAVDVGTLAFDPRVTITP